MHTRPATAASAPEPADPDVITAVLGGELSQFAVLVRRHNQVLFRACRAILRDDADAEDAVQVAWIQAYRALRDFRGDARFRTWITRIAIREASARLHQRRRLRAMADDHEGPAAGSDPARDVFEREVGRLLEREIDALPDGMRHVLVLRDIIELDTAETATCLGIRDEAVRVRLHRARQALAASMTDALATPERAAPSVWRFDGERCARVLDRVMSAIVVGPLP